MHLITFCVHKTMIRQDDPGIPIFDKNLLNCRDLNEQQFPFVKLW